MKRFLRTLALLVAANLAASALLLAIDAVYVRRHVRHTWQTEQSWLIMPSHKHFGFVFLGSSHARVLSGSEAIQAEVEQALGGRAMNLGVSGGGVLPALVYLNLFYERGNTADTVLYVVDAWALYRREWNENNPFYEVEPFSLSLVRQLLAQGYTPKQILYYLKRKVDPLRLIAEPFKKTFAGIMERSLETVDRKTADSRLWGLYGYMGNDGKEFAAYVARYVAGARYARLVGKLREVVALARTHGSRVFMVIPPTLFEDDCGLDPLRELLKEMNRTEGVGFLDCSGAMPDPRDYYHVDHLNRRGVAFFTRRLLRPALDRQAGHVSGTESSPGNAR